VKKVLVFSLAAVLSIGFAACGGDSGEAKPSAAAPAPAGNDSDSAETQVSASVDDSTDEDDPFEDQANKNVLPEYHGIYRSWYEGDEVKLYLLDLVGYQPEELPFLRNEIYARYGRPFTNKVYQEYFAAKPWYRVKSDYSDAMLSEADKANAELILSLEQPSLNFADTVASVLKNIEYRGTGAILTFTSKHELVWTDPSADFGFYAVNSSVSQTVPWLVMGDWILVYVYASEYEHENEYGSAHEPEDDYAAYIVAAYKLNHAAKTITVSTKTNMEYKSLKKLIAAQKNR
jgi:hypothetical protein